MQIKIKVPQNASLAHAVSAVNKRLCTEMRKIRKKAWPDIPERFRPWPRCRMVSLTSAFVEYAVSTDVAAE